MALFNKKYCDICGGSMGLIIDNHAADGNYCHACAKKLSPFFHGGKNCTLAQIKQQLMAREQNRQQLNSFNATKVFGYKTKVYVDEGHGCFVVSDKSDYRNANADIINIRDVAGVTSDVKEHKKEIYQKDSQGHNVSYNPKRYDYSYEIIVTITVNSLYFNKIEFEVTKDRPTNRNSAEFAKYQNEANQIIAVLTGRQPAGMQQQNTGAGIGQAVAGIAGLAGLAGALIGTQQAMQGQQAQQQGFNNQGFNQQQGYVDPSQQNFNNQGFNNQGFGNQQQGFNNQGFNNQQQGFNNQGFGNQQQGFNNQGFGNQQQGFNNQGFGAQQGFNNQGFNQQQGFNNQGFNQQQGFNQGFNQQGFNQQGGQWFCPNCGTANTGAFCQSCGSQRMQ